MIAKTGVERANVRHRLKQVWGDRNLPINIVCMDERTGNIFFLAGEENIMQHKAEEQKLVATNQSDTLKHGMWFAWLIFNFCFRSITCLQVGDSQVIKTLFLKCGVKAGIMQWQMHVMTKQQRIAICLTGSEGSF
jgi:hypothetical protein